jgi:AbrB family looped-hinge helix DNA binding protein
MTKSKTSQLCDTGCCQIEALVTIDGRGQLVLPKDVREKAGIKPGDKLALISWEREGEICCLSLQKASDFTEMIKKTIGPAMKDILS